MSGWFAVSREILDHPIFNGRPDRLYAWIWILSNAAYRDTQQDVGGCIVDVPRGSLCASQAMMQRGTGMSRQSLRTFIDLLKKENVIDTYAAANTTKSRTIVKVCNYDKYQAQQPSQQPSSNQAATKEQPSSNQAATNKRNKETNKQINNTPKPPNGGSVVSVLESVASKEAVASFVEYRKRQRKALTVTAAERLAKVLSEIAANGGDPGDALGMAEERGWQSVKADWYFREAKAQGKALAGGHKPAQYAPGQEWRAQL